MAADLNTTTLAGPITASQTVIRLTSASLVTRGDLLYIGKEAMSVGVVTTSANSVQVTRGLWGTRAQAHNQGDTVYSDVPARFYSRDPDESSQPGPLPTWINLITGAVWVARGDPSIGGPTVRYIKSTPAAYAIGPLGVPVIS